MQMNWACHLSCQDLTLTTQTLKAWSTLGLSRLHRMPNARGTATTVVCKMLIATSPDVLCHVTQPVTASAINFVHLPSVATWMSIGQHAFTQQHLKPDMLCHIAPSLKCISQVKKVADQTHGIRVGRDRPLGNFQVPFCLGRCDARCFYGTGPRVAQCINDCSLLLDHGHEHNCRRLHQFPPRPDLPRHVREPSPDNRRHHGDINQSVSILVL